MNETTASIARNTKAMMFSQIVTWASSFVLMLFLPRYLGAEDYGRLYFAITINALGSLAMDLGFTALIVKEIARDRTKANALAVNAGALRVLLWVVSLVGTLAFVRIAGYSAEAMHVVFVLGIANVFFGLYDLLHRVFVGLERMEFRSYALIIEKVFLAVVGVSLLLMGANSFVIALAMLASMMLNFLASVYFLRKLIPVSLTLDPSLWPSLLRAGLPFMISTVLGFIYYRIDVMMLSAMTNEKVVGWYGAPYKLFDTLMFFPTILNTAVYPVLARLYHLSKESMVQTSRKILDLTMIIGVPIAVGMVALARPIIAFLFGLQEFEQSVVLLQVLSASLLLIYVDFVLNTVLISNDRQKKIVFVSLAATVINVTVNYYAIAYFHQNFGNGAIGAAITTAITELCVMSMSFAILPKGCFNVQNLSLAAKTILAGLIMGGVMWGLEQHVVGWVVAGAAGVLVYVGILLMMKVLTRREVQFFLSLVPFRKVAATSPSNN
jgi:O-antigen/teichoic acid export membrane protein